MDLGKVAGNPMSSNRRFYRNKKPAKNFFGENESSEDFGVPRKIWLYVYRVKRQVTPQTIIDHIKNQCIFKEADVIVKELPPSENQNKCFMFCIDYKYKDSIYNPTIWPRSVAFRRFNFSKYNQYQQHNEEDFL